MDLKALHDMVTSSDYVTPSPEGMECVEYWRAEIPSVETMLNIIAQLLHTVRTLEQEKESDS